MEAIIGILIGILIGLLLIIVIKLKGVIKDLSRIKLITNEINSDINKIKKHFGLL